MLQGMTQRRLLTSESSHSFYQGQMDSGRAEGTQRGEQGFPQCRPDSLSGDTMETATWKFVGRRTAEAEGTASAKALQRNLHGQGRVGESLRSGGRTL